MRRGNPEAAYKFWRKKKVLITGFSGFLGSWLTRALVLRGADVTGLDIITRRKPSVLTKYDLSSIDIIKADVADYAAVYRAIRSKKFEYIFHLAAESQVGNCTREPLRALSVNIAGTWNVLEAARQANHRGALKGIIVASSDKAYGTRKNLPYREVHPLAGEHPYDVSKSCADLIAQAYVKTYSLPAAIVRCGNIFGPGDFNYSRIIPDTVMSALRGSTLIIRSNGRFTRDYIYVEDVIRGYLILAEKMRVLKLYGEAFNFSGERPISVLDLVKRVYRLAARPQNYRIVDRAKHEIKDQYLSARKARKILGWKAAYTLEDGLEYTLEWYDANYR